MSIVDDLKVYTAATIGRDGKVVSLEFLCEDEYAAILLYDKVFHAMNKGGVVLAGIQLTKRQEN